MWLLDTSTGKLHYIVDPSWENYAILSHVWIAGKEQSFQDLQRLHELTTRAPLSHRTRGLLGLPTPSAALSRASEKIRECCAFARARDYRWLWVDTCCIDKTSSSELSEAINSMYQWYQQSGVCYAFLHDVDDEEDPRAQGSQFRQSKWFRRGWTLQELIAPRELVFISKQWRPFGTKTSLADVVEEITGVQRDVLEHKRPLSTVSVARRMSWASKRKTTRVEDEAYSLMGIFGVNIPVIYGEGRNAFYRLQEEILRRIPDQSIFAWGPLVYERYAWPCEQFGRPHLQSSRPEDASYEYLFASTPAAFESSAGIASVPLDEFYREIPTSGRPVPEYMLTSYGIRTRFPKLLRNFLHLSVEEQPRSSAVDVVVLACRDATEGLVTLLLRSMDDQTNHLEDKPEAQDAASQYKVGARYAGGFVRGATLRCILNLQDAQIIYKVSTRLLSVYIPYRPFELVVPSYATRYRARLQENGDSDSSSSRPARFECPCEVVIQRWTAARLRRMGYAISTTSGDDTTLHVPEKGSKVHLVLSRGNNKDGIFIGLAPCTSPHGFVMPPPLTVVVSFGAPPVHSLAPRVVRSDYLGTRPQEACKKEHVHDWRDGSADFSHNGRTVRLAFSSWTNQLGSGNNRGLYALVIELDETHG
ncbi:heterokaryon incompatibility protein-domain-containing protein [Trametes punicea]|nr:heterokaryon incompatibility protein-domain-containing protein [Trametes punicea]